MTDIVTPPTIAPLPPAPLLTDTQADFNVKAFATVGALADFVGSANALAAATNTNATAAQERAALAQAGATAAGTARDQAQASALTAVNAPGTSGTSATSMTLGAGERNFVTQAGKAWAFGQAVQIARTSDPSGSRMYAVIVSYNVSNGAITVQVPAGAVTGSGTYSDWSISLTATREGLAPTDSPAFTSKVGIEVAAGIAAPLTGKQGAFTRWTVSMPNAGGDYSISPHDDSGVLKPAAVTISRATGGVTIAGSVAATDEVRVNRASTASPARLIFSTANIIRWNMQATPGADAFVLFHHDVAGGGAVAMQYIDGTNGDVTYLGTVRAPAVVQTSDQRVKSNLAPIDNALTKLQQLTGYTYDRSDLLDANSQPQRRAGVLAQDALLALPETVHVPADYDAEAVIGGLLGLDLNGLVALLINATKDLAGEVATLRAQVNA